MFAFDLAFGYEFNQKHSVFAGLGLQYGKYDYSSSFSAFLTPSGTQVESDSSSKSGYTIGERAFIGYEYNFTKAISFNTKLAYSYMEPNLGDNVKVETDIIDFGIGAKYNF